LEILSFPALASILIVHPPSGTHSARDSDPLKVGITLAIISAARPAMAALAETSFRIVTT
jgi:hypothetical protein